MNDSRLLTHNILGDEFASAIALATFENKGIVIWEEDCVLLASFHDESFSPCADSLFIIWAAGDLKRIAEAIERAHVDYVVFQRELNRRRPSSRFRKLKAERAIKIIYYSHGQRLV